MPEPTPLPPVAPPVEPAAAPAAGPAMVAAMAPAAGAGAGPPRPLAAEQRQGLAALAQACTGCQRCGLAQTRQQVVVSRGNPAARLLLIGEAPGAQEDASGQPFVGKAGQLLDRMLASVDLDRDRDVYLCNVIKCRPPDNRRPTPAEIAACRPFLLRQIELVDPALILLLGATALEGVLGIRGGITRLRGQWRAGSGEVLAGRWLMPIFHPSYLLRNASRQPGSPKWLTWQDLREVKRCLQAEGAPVS